ncbi:MAG TPA: response regulator [Actinomycetota bacterium]|nr:response regulator [Actinomycetota bacterium]
MTTVLICDDVAELRSLIKRALRSETDIEVVGEAANGQQAVEMAASLQPDVVVLDIQMPVMDGFQALEGIRRDCPASKVIMLSGLNASNLEATAMSLGADDYMEKGAYLGSLGERIRSLTGSG